MSCQKEMRINSFLIDDKLELAKEKGEEFEHKCPNVLAETKYILTM